MKRLVAGFAAILLLLGLAAPLAAQTTDASLEVLRVDLREGRGFVTVRPGADSTIADLSITAGGDNLVTSSNPIARSAVNGFTILVVDNSVTADQVVGFSTVRQAALAYLSGVAADTRVMLIAAGGGNPEVRPLVPFTVNHQLIREELEAMRVDASAVTWNAISQSTAAFAEQGEGVRNVVAFIGSPGTGSTIPASAAQGNLLNASSSFTVVAPDVANLETRNFETVASNVRGGATFRANEQASMADAALAAVRTHENTIVASIDTSKIGENTSELTVSLGEQSERVRFVPGGLATGDALLAPDIPTPSRFEVLRGNQGAMIAIGLGVVAALLFSYAMMSILAGTDNTLNSTLAVYGADESDEEVRAADNAFSSVRSKIVEQVVEKAEEAAASRGALATQTNMLEKAEIPLRVGEAMAVQVGIVLAAMVVGFLVSGSPIGAVLLAIPAAILPTTYVKWKIKKRKKMLESQLPDTLNLLSSTLKAGYSFIQGIDAVGNEADEPLAGEFRRTVNEARLGRDIDDALDDLAERVDSVDLLWAIVAIKIQREVGGNLAELLSTVADTMTARSRLRGEVAALTAEGRMSAWVLVFLPVGVGIAMYFMNPGYISTLWQNTMGLVAIGAGLLGMVVGTVWMRKIIDIKI